MHFWILTLSGIGVLSLFLAVYEAAVRLFQRKKEERYLIDKLYSREKIVSLIKRYEELRLLSEKHKFSSANKSEIREIEKLQGTILRMLDEEMKNQFSSYKDKLKQTKTVVLNSREPQKSKYLEKIFQRLLTMDLAHH